MHHRLRPTSAAHPAATALLAALVAGAAACGPAPTTQSPPLTVMTYNVMCSFCTAPGADPWETRLPYIFDAIDRHDPDLMGIEELTYKSEVTEFLHAEPQYAAIYFIDPGTPGTAFPEYPDATIFYRTSRFTEVEHGTYWLSPTPDTLWSTGFGNTLWRLVTWAHLKEKATGRDLYFAATHFDNTAPSQSKSAPLVVSRTAPWAKKMPAIIVGDFNSTPDTDAYKTLAAAFDDTHELAATPRIDSNETSPTFDPAMHIDHIWVTGGAWKASDWVVGIHSYGDPARYPSDHFPVAATIDWPRP